MDPKQLVENVRKYWDEEPSLVNNSSVLQDPAPAGKQISNNNNNNNNIRNKQRPSTTTGVGPRHRKKEIVVKDWTYWRKNAYRGGGAIWTDPSVHCPPSRQKFVGRRPDLDALHMQYVNKQIAKEKRKNAKKLKSRSDAKRKQQTRFLKQREMNHIVEMGIVNGRPTTAPQISMHYNIPNNNIDRNASGAGGGGESIEEDRSMQLTPRITMEGNVIKDQKFYRRNGSIWTDYIHTAPDRLHLVLNDKIINADKKAADLIRQKYEEDRYQEELEEMKKIMRTKEMREEFQAKQKYGSKVMKATKLTPCSRRINELARPKTARDAYKEAGPFDGMDFKGLLLTDHTVGPLVQDRVRRNAIKKERKRAGTAPANSSRRNRNSRNSSKNSNGSQSARGPRVRTAPTTTTHQTGGLLNESLSRGSSRRARPNTAAYQSNQQRRGGSRPNTAPAWAPQQQKQQMNGGWGDISMEGVIPSIDQNSIVGAMMREAQGTIAELDTFEDRRDMLDRRKGYEGPENWFRSDLDKEKKKNSPPRKSKQNFNTETKTNVNNNRPSTAPVTSNRTGRRNNRKVETKSSSGNYWNFLSSKEEEKKKKTRPSKYSKERMIYNRRKVAKKNVKEESKRSIENPEDML